MPARAHAAGTYRRLDPLRVVATAAALAQRIDERFPGSSLAAMARELLAIASECGGRLERMQRPNWPLRAVAAFAVAVLIAGLAAALASLEVTMSVQHVAELVQAIEAAINDAVFVAIALFFIFTLEGRLKRRRVLAALHELRSIAHIVDMHQLTKDPEQVLNPGMARTPSSPPRTMSRFELARYLDYCSELLSLTAKVASLHAQDLRDPVVLSAVNDVEQLAVGLSQKIWQKIMILDEVRLRAGELAEPGPLGGAELGRALPPR